MRKKKQLVNWYLGKKGERVPMTSRHEFWGTTHRSSRIVNGYGESSAVTVTKYVTEVMTAKQYEKFRRHNP